MTYDSQNPIDRFGAEPVNIQWKVVRGDTATLRVEFWENDEVTEYDTSLWTYSSTAYDFTNNTSTSLNVTPGVGYVDIVATPEITSDWGIGYRNVTVELAFDLQVTIDESTIWTPVLGTIAVRPDVTLNGAG